MVDKPDLQKYVAEFLGTFLLAFVGAGAAMMAALTDAASGQIMGGIASGVILMIAIWIFANISGGHVNPALTLVLCLIGDFPPRLLPGYILAQLSGSAAAGGCLLALLGRTAGMGANRPNTFAGVTPFQAFGVEVVLSFTMMVVIIFSVAAKGAPGKFFAVPIGAIVGLNVMMFGGTYGAAMNPARAFGPYFVSGEWQFFWIYAIGPVSGMLIAALIVRWLIGYPHAT